ncbi:signal peptidase I [Candidatus Omnitrophota bacterium]
MICKSSEFLTVSKELLSRGIIRFKVFGTSMCPFIMSGQIIQVEQVDACDINYADIVLYRNNKAKAFVHRVVAKRTRDGKTAFLVKGDSLPKEDGYIYPDDILGKVVVIEKDKKIIRMDRGLWRYINSGYARSLPLSRWFYSGFRRIFRSTRSARVREDELLILFARVTLSERQIARVGELLRYSLDWEYIFERSCHESISPLLQHHLHAHKQSKYVPAHILQELERSYYRNAQRNIRMLEQIQKVLKGFGKEKIKAIVLKGAFLAEHIYKNIALRPCGDIDILIKKEDRRRVHSLLGALGYTAPAHCDDLLKDHSLNSINTLMYKAEGASSAPLHIHWHLINSTWPLDHFVRRIDMKSIWNRSESVAVADSQTLALGPEHLLIYSSMHSLTHYFGRFILLSDIAEVVRHYKDRINWQLLGREAERFDLSWVVYSSLSYVARAFELEIPQLDRLKPDKLSFLESILILFMRRGIRSYKLSYLVYLAAERGFLSRVRFVAKTFIPSSDIMAHIFGLPASKIRPYHYFRRIASSHKKILTLL